MINVRFLFFFFFLPRRLFPPLHRLTQEEMSCHQTEVATSLKHVRAPCARAVAVATTLMDNTVFIASFLLIAIFPLPSLKCCDKKKKSLLKAYTVTQPSAIANLLQCAP